MIIKISFLSTLLQFLIHFIHIVINILRKPNIDANVSAQVQLLQFVQIGESCGGNFPDIVAAEVDVLQIFVIREQVSRQNFNLIA
jgi:hypothetical protein